MFRLIFVFSILNLQHLNLFGTVYNARTILTYFNLNPENRTLVLTVGTQSPTFYFARE